MKLIDKIIISFIAIVLTTLICICVDEIDNLQEENKQLSERIKQLEVDYKIYELNLSQLQENKTAQFDNEEK